MSWHNIHALVDGQSNYFKQLLEKPELTQSSYLKKLVDKNKDSEFGLSHNFTSITSIELFQKNVPLQEYADLENDIYRMQQGESNILCDEAVISFERTGGSSGGDKYVPYTNSSLNSFHSALYPWLDDLLSSRPGIKDGTLYWSISPSLEGASYTNPDSLSNDANYFSPDLANEFSKLLTLPESILHVHDLKTWQYFTSRYLLDSENLSFISIWSPTFLIDLMAYILNNQEQLSSDIKQGIISINSQLYSQNEHPRLLQAAPSRADIITRACTSENIDGTQLWPMLDTISCWQDSTSRQFIPQLAALFKGVNLQAKGLIATEGIVSTPLSKHKASVLAIDSAFFEFRDTTGNIHLAHEIQASKSYEVIISNYSGLYRYELGDIIEVTGFAGHTPLIKFVGRSGITSDLCGEKLNEAFVQQQLESVDGFTMLMPITGNKRAYILIVDASQYDAKKANELAAAIDYKLMKNPQYAYARRIHQLAAVTAIRTKSLWEKYIKHEFSRNRIIGDIKACSLYTDTDFLKLIHSEA